MMKARKIRGRNMETYVIILHMRWSAYEKTIINIGLYTLEIAAVVISQMNSERL